MDATFDAWRLRGVVASGLDQLPLSWPTYIRRELANGSFQGSFARYVKATAGHTAAELLTQCRVTLLILTIS